MPDVTRVLLVDDSPLFTDALTEILRRHPDIEVAGIARDGAEAVSLVHRLEPDLVTMDLHMPTMNGLDAVEEIMATKPTPIIVLTADEKSRDQSWCFDALRRGALELAPKPDIDAMFDQAGIEFCERVRMLAKVPVVHHARNRKVVPTLEPPMPGRADHIPAAVGIVASTGGPSALAELLGSLPPNFPLPIAIVQHLADGFTPHLAQWLSDFCLLRIQVASRSTQLEPGVVLLAPEGRHLLIGPHGGADFSLETGHAHCPSGDKLLASLASTFRERAIGIVLTGMGRDGAKGLLKIRNKGGLTLVQSAESCVVNGMPQAARDLGAAQQVLPLNQISTALLQYARDFTLAAGGKLT